MGTLVAMIKSTQQLLKFSANSVLVPDQEDADEQDGELILVEIDSIGEMIFDVNKLQNYSETLYVTKQTESDAPYLELDKKGNAAALLLLQLELVYEILENKAFHKQLIPLIESENGSDVLQTYFLDLSEQILQLLALSNRSLSSSRGTSNEKKHVHSYISVQLGELSLDITVDSLGKTVGNWCLEILKSMEKVLDAPSFVAILQELLDHEDGAVRQTALHILGQRLSAMSQGKRPGAEEVTEIFYFSFFHFFISSFLHFFSFSCHSLCFVAYVKFQEICNMNICFVRNHSLLNFVISSFI